MFRRDVAAELLPPGVCALCSGGSEPFVDTLRQNKNVPIGSPIHGRQYVCGNCVEQLAEALGITSDQAALKKATNQVAYWRRKAEKNADILEQLKEFVGANTDEPAVQD